MDSSITNDNSQNQKSFPYEETIEKLKETIGLEATMKILNSFVNDSSKSLESIDHFLSLSDLSEIHKIGHRNKSSASIVGANGLADLFTKLETAENIEVANELNKQIKHESLEVSSKIEGYEKKLMKQ